MFISILCLWLLNAFSVFTVLTLLVGWQEGHLACKKTEWWGAGMAICLERGADLHTAQLMPLPLTVSCFSKIQIGFTFLIPTHLGSLGKSSVKWLYVYVCGCCSERECGAAERCKAELGGGLSVAGAPPMSLR